VQIGEIRFRIWENSSSEIVYMKNTQGWDVFLHTLTRFMMKLPTSLIVAWLHEFNKTCINFKEKENQENAIKYFKEIH